MQQRISDVSGAHTKNSLYEQQIPDGIFEQKKWEGAETQGF